MRSTGYVSQLVLVVKDTSGWGSGRPLELANQAGYS
jgi:hypothetical protein